MGAGRERLSPGCFPGLAYICEGLNEQRKGLVTLVLWNNQLTHTGMAYLGMTLVSSSWHLPGRDGFAPRGMSLPPLPGPDPGSVPAAWFGARCPGAASEQNLSLVPLRCCSGIAGRVLWGTAVN